MKNTHTQMIGKISLFLSLCVCVCLFLFLCWLVNFFGLFLGVCESWSTSQVEMPAGCVCVCV